MTVSMPSARSRRPSVNMAYVFPTPGAAPMYTWSAPRGTVCSAICSGFVCTGRDEPETGFRLGQEVPRVGRIGLEFPTDGHHEYVYVVGLLGRGDNEEVFGLGRRALLGRVG